MSVLGRQIPFGYIAALAAVMVLAGLIPALSSTPSREITLVVRGMAFYIDGEFDTPNPTIELRTGERVRIRVRNEDRGLTHDFAADALGAEIAPLRWSQSASVTFEAGEPGLYQYVCRPHQLMMRGSIRIR